MTSPASETQWTPDQRAAIASRGTELIVSAAAGSGKTAVLTERVLKLVTFADPPASDPVLLEQLLVITFTRKAAREMRERIERKIQERLVDEPDHKALRDALDALPRASIMTLDAFCDRLVRRHFHRAGISPDARIAEDREDREIADTAAAQIFEELSAVRDDSAGGDERLAADTFADLLASTPRERESETATLMGRVHRLRSFLASLDQRDAWKNFAEDRLLRILAADEFKDLPHLDSIATALAVGARDLADLLSRACDEAGKRGGDSGFLASSEVLVSEMRAIADLLKKAESHEIAASIGAFREFLIANSDMLEKLSNKNVCGEALFRMEAFKDGVLKKVASEFSKFRKTWFALDAGELLRAEKLAATQGLALLHLALRIEDRVQEIKRRRGVLGFADMARKALDLLSDPESGGPSEISDEYRGIFKHVLVDEYQDISPLQDAIIRRLARAGGDYPAGERNLFMVGDIKQSVYRFRRAEPALFARRLDEHGKADPALTRVDLRSNFRSRPGVLEGVNALCARLMDRAIGGIDYDDAACLRATRETGVGEPVCVEAGWILRPNAAAEEEDEFEAENVDVSEPTETAAQNLSGIELEVEWIARRILELTHPIDGLRIPDEKTKSTRVLRAGDCAILVRNLRSDASVWIETLSRHGLHVRGAGERTESESLEQSDLMSALKVADNPFDDYALAAVLRSPMFSLSDDDLLRIRMARREGPFHAAFWTAAGRGAAFDADEKAPAFQALPAELLARVESVAGQIDAWRTAAERTDAEGAMDAILRSTGYEAHVAGLNGARERMAVLRDLRDSIRSHASRGVADLSSFLALQGKASISSSGGNDEEELEAGANSVRLMTVHKSKGLEFPVVFYARLASPFVQTDSRSGLQLSQHEGIALEAIDPVRRMRMKPPSLLAMRSEELRQVRSEELRLMYVAMTRARERLILVGSHYHWKDETRLRERWRNRPMAFDGLPPAVSRLSAISAADLIAPSLLRMTTLKAPHEWLSFGFERIERNDRPAAQLMKIREWARMGDASDASRRQEAVLEFAQVFSADPRVAASLTDLIQEQGKIAFPVPSLILPSDQRVGLSRTPVKVFASTLRRDSEGAWMLADPKSAPEVDEAEWNVFAEESWTPPAPLIRGEKSDMLEPAFVQSRARIRLDPAAIGTHTHALLRHLDLRGDLDEAGLLAQAAALKSRGLLEFDSDEYLKELPLADVAWFFTTPLGRMMVDRPGAVLRELPFRRWIRASELHDISQDGSVRPLTSADEDGRVLVQGVVDCVLDAGSEVIVLDYKTDNVRSRREVENLAARYEAQIDAYRSAIRAVWRTSINRTSLIFLRAHEIVDIADPTQ